MLTPTITYIGKVGSQIRVGFKLAPSGTYTTGGDTVDLATAATDPALIGPGTAIPASTAPINIDIWDESGNVGVTAGTAVFPVAGTNSSNCKMKCVTALGTELGNGLAYPASVLAATLVGEASFNFDI